MKLTCETNNPPIGGILTAGFLDESLKIGWGNETVYEKGSAKHICRTSNDLCRILAVGALNGQTAEEKTEIDHWLCYSLSSLSSDKSLNQQLEYLNRILATNTYLAAKKLTVADFSVFGALYSHPEWQPILASKNVPVNLSRWYNLIMEQKGVRKCLNLIPKPAQQPAEKSAKSQEGKFIDLPGAEMGKVVVRFPPEASGYLHIGHAKAALLNQYYQQAFKGKLIMRFDDTNPAKENVHFEEVILKDLEMLEIHADQFTYTSDYFDLMLGLCEKMIKEGKAYVDDTEPELMKQQREQKVESANRSNSVEKNLALWKEMQDGTKKGQICCVRAKIDMQSLNGCMRDPTIYRCKPEPHPRTGTKYKVYPTYDFACPIVDAIENVTHTLRTMEYHDRDAQFYWFIEALNLRRPYIWEYSRLSMTNTVLSKRKLTWFVDEGLVDGWDDPRFPTVRGVLRRGMTVEGLKQFIIAQGSSRSVVFMEWDKIWAFNKKVIDPIAPRYTAVDYTANVPVLIPKAKLEPLTVVKHPKNAEVGSKTVWVGPKLLIDAADAECLQENTNATFINWGNVLIKKINRKEGKVVSVEAEPNLENKEYSKTLKLTWLCETEKAPFSTCFCVYFDHIISKPLLGKDEDFKKYVGHETRKEVQVIGDPELRNVKIGDIIQLQRKGFFRVDVAYEPANDTCEKERPVILFAIPDGHTKENPIASAPAKFAAEEKREKPRAKRTAEQVDGEVVKQGDLVRSLKASKADKGQVDAAVKVLLQLKEEFKGITGADWKPGAVPAVKSSDSGSISDKIAAQGDKVRKLKADKAEKALLDAEVKVLLELKQEYKTSTGQEWKPGATVAPAKSSDSASISDKIAAQGDKVRKLKADKAEKALVDAEVKVLLELKQEYKTSTGQEWKPGATVAPAKSSDSASISDKIAAQGDKVRKLKADKAEKALVDAEVKVLLQLKEQFKSSTGNEWKPGATVVPPKPSDSSSISDKIAAQGDKVRKLKADKAEKALVDAEVKVLLELKQEYKTSTGQEWKPGATVAPPKPSDSSSISDKIAAQGDKVRKLKAEKAEKALVDAEVKVLLQLKEQFKSSTGNEWKPDLKMGDQKPSSAGGNSAKDELVKKVGEQGEVVRNLKSSKASKESIDAAVKKLLDLKAEYKTVTGEDFPTAARAPAKPKEAKEKPAPVKKEKKPDVQDDGSQKKQTRLGLEAKKEENLSEWYTQVITKGEMIEYYDVSGCYILRPWSFGIWEVIRDWFDAEIKKLGVQNCYFPIFVSRAALEKEKTHIADFAPEVAWVTKSGNTDLAEPIAVRPTSETVMYPAYAKWIQSYRDLPILLNQWNNVVRWEFKHPQPFLRTREFLWQEGHTAHATKAAACEEVSTILDLYAKIYTDLLAIPVVKGRKTEKEKFAGGDYTLTVEGYISASGRGIQGATSHHLGQNFSKMFDITFKDPETRQTTYVFQNSWGITTRTIGVVIMVHADNQGLVLPPRVANIQIVIVPCGLTADASDADILKSCQDLEQSLRQAGMRASGDYRDNYLPGWKFNHWELKGVPIRVELGPKDLKNSTIVAVRRDTGEKIIMKRPTAVAELSELLEKIQKNLYDKAAADLKKHTIVLKEWANFTDELDNKKIIMSPFCGDCDCEDKIKANSARDTGGDAEPGAPAMGAKSLCIPLEQPCALEPADKCINPECSRKPQFYTLFGRSY